MQGLSPDFSLSGLTAGVRLALGATHRQVVKGFINELTMLKKKKIEEAKGIIL